MFKRILMILLVLAVLLSFSTAVLAGQDAELPISGKSALLNYNEDGKLVEIYLPLVAKTNANENSRAANNPIDVAGKRMM